MSPLGSTRYECRNCGETLSRAGSGKPDVDCMVCGQRDWKGADQ